MPCYPRILTIRNMTSTLIFDTRFDSKSSGCGEQYDGFVCWPPTPTGQVAKVPCSHIKVRRHYRTLHRAKNLASGENSALVWNDESEGYSQVFGELFRSASHAVEAGSRFVRKFSGKWRRHWPLHRNSAEMFRSANAYKDCGLTGWAKKADYVECIRAMAKVITS